MISVFLSAKQGRGEQRTQGRSAALVLSSEIASPRSGFGGLKWEGGFQLHHSKVQKMPNTASNPCSFRRGV